MATLESPASKVINLEALINPTDRQREFLAAIADYDYPLYGGAAGGGKSYILRWSLILFLVAVYRELGLKNVQVGLFCEDYPTLMDRQISKMRYEFPAWLGRMVADRDFKLNPEFGGGNIALRNLDDPSKYQSAEFAAIAVDELTKHTKETFDFLRFRLRWPGIERPKFLAATNPGGIGHPWVKDLWVLRRFPEELKPLSNEFAFVQAKATDNPHLTENYWNSLRTLPPDMARKYVEGSWDVYTGQYFNRFSPEQHVIPASVALGRCKPWHTYWLSGDWGYEHPHAIYLHCRDEHGRITTIAELWDKHVSEPELASRITHLCSVVKMDAIRGFVFSWDAGKLSPRSQARIPRSIMQLIADNLPKHIPSPHPGDSSPGSRISGWRLMDELLMGGTWQISDACQRLIECIPTLIRDEDNSEDVLKVDHSDGVIGDDPADAVRMGMQYMRSAAFKPRDVELQETLVAVAETSPNEQEAVQRQSMAHRWFNTNYKAPNRAFTLNKPRYRN